MSAPALIMMISVQALVTFMASYFLYRVLTSKPKPGNPVKEDSYKDNDPDTNATTKT